MIRQILHFQLIFFLLVFVSCSAKITPPKEKSRLVNPYQLAVIDELYDGESLYLQLEIKEKAKPLNQLSLLSLIGFDKDSKQVEKFFNLKDLEMDLENQITLVLPIKNLVDYQLQLYWGEQALEFYKLIYPKLAKKIKIFDGQVEKLRQCQDASCQIKFRMKFNLLNKNEMTVPHLNLIISLFEQFFEDSSLPATELYSKSIKLTDFNIKKGEVRQLEYVIIQPKDLEEVPTEANISVSKKF